MNIMFINLKRQEQFQQMGLAQSMGFKPTLPPQYEQKDYILMTYRSGIVPVEKTTYYTSDSGWGCMLRVAQMFIANLLTKQQQHASNQAIIRLFYDNLMVPFSIQMITKVSAKLFQQMKPYAWYTPCQAGFIVKNLLENFDTKYKVVICNDGSMFLDDILKVVKEDQQKVKNCSNLQSSQSYQQHQNIETKVVVLLMARIGLDSPQPGYIKCISKFMQNKYFVSIMGGTPKRAHLILQYFDGYFGFIDPHTTRPVVQDYAKVTDYMDQYTSKVIWIKEEKIDSSMCVGFCFSKSQLLQFWKSMKELKEQMKENFFIYIDEQRPMFDEDGIIQIGGYSDEEEGEQQQQK